MDFLWHHALWLLLALPILAGTYLVLLQRKHKVALRYATFTLVREAVGRTAQFRLHLPALLMLCAVAVLLLAAARPVWIITSPSERGTVILLIDVSLSMAATDVPPTRLAAARAAARAFVKAQPRDVRIGIVAFGAHADVVQPPTTDRVELAAALDRLDLQRFTAIGNGLMGALLTLVPRAAIPPGYDVFGMGRPPEGYEMALDQRQAPTGSHKAVAPGSYLSAAIILVSDGRGTMGVPAAAAAKIVAGYGIRVYTIGVGTLYGGTAIVEGWPAIHAEFEEDTLKEVADITHGEYFLARNAEKVTRIYEKLGRRVVLERREFEVSALFTAIGMVLSVASGALSLLWSHRPA